MNAKSRTSLSSPDVDRAKKFFSSDCLTFVTGLVASVPKPTAHLCLAPGLALSIVTIGAVGVGEVLDVAGSPQAVTVVATGGELYASVIIRVTCEPSKASVCCVTTFIMLVKCGATCFQTESIISPGTHELLPQKNSCKQSWLLTQYDWSGQL